MMVKVNFTDPLIISRGFIPDRAICKIINPNLFVAESGERLSSMRVFLQAKLPRLLPQGVIEEEIEKDAKSAQQGMIAIVVL